MRPPACSVSGLLSLIPLERVSQTHPEVMALECAGLAMSVTYKWVIEIVVFKETQVCISVADINGQALPKAYIEAKRRCRRKILLHISNIIPNIEATANK